MPRAYRSSRSVLLSLACVALLSTGCPGEETRSLPERPPPSGTLRLAYPEEPGSLNPIMARSSAARDILRAVLPSFHLVTPDLRYRPYLLASEPRVTTMKDRMLVRFRIRENARWSDGRPMSVDDVVFTWQVMTDTELPVAVRDGFEYVVDVVKESPRAGTLILSPPFAGWRDLFSAGRFILPKPATGRAAVVEAWEQGPPVSGGPFRIGRWVRGKEIVLQRNPRFFGLRALVEEIHIDFVPDATTALQLLQIGNVDVVAPTLGISWGHRLAAIPDVGTSARFGPDLVHLVVNTPASSDAGMRRRVADAIDRDRFAAAIIRDEGRKADGVLAPEQEGALPEWERYGTGADSPEELRTDEELTLVFTKGELLEIAARYVQAELERAGGDVELVPLDADAFQGEWLPEQRFDLALWESRSGPEPWLTRWYGDTGDERVSRVIDTELNEFLHEADGGGPRRERALTRAQERLAELVPVLPLFQPRVTMGWRDGVSGLEANPTVDGPLWNAWNWSIASEAA
jgi:peptide/nickel transport system substrate-binding protein